MNTPQGVAGRSLAAQPRQAHKQKAGIVLSTSTSLKEWKEAGKTAFRMLLYFAVFYLLGYVLLVLPLVYLSRLVPGIKTIISTVFSVVIIFAFLIAVSKVIHEMLGNAGYLPQNNNKVNVKPLKIEVKKKK